MDQNELTRIAEEYYRLAKRVVRVVVGFTLLVVGVALIVLPGPAFVVIPIALAILAGEFLWAQRLLRRVKTQVAQYTGYGREELDKEELEMQEPAPAGSPEKISPDKISPEENKSGVSASRASTTPRGRA